MDGAAKVSVKEYAEQNQISVQSVYKKINKGTLKTAREKINGKEVLYILLEDQQPEDLNHFKPIKPDVKPIQPVLNQDEVEFNQTLNPDSTTLNQPEVEMVEMVENVLNPNSTTRDGSEQGIIAFLQEQLQEKDRQIERLQEQTRQQAEENREKDKVIQEQLAKMNELLRNAQSLQAQSNLLFAHKQQQAEEEAPAEDQVDIVAADQPEETPQPKPRRSWLYRFFFGED